MIPVLGVPYISRSDLFVAMITSINHPIKELVVIDNSNDGSCPQVDDARYIKMHRNMGVSWAWNTIIQSTPMADWWCIVNSDIKFGPTDLGRLEEAMGSGYELVLLSGMALFGISASCIEKVGWFDTNFVPAYCEDMDYSWRGRLLGIKALELGSDSQHSGSATIGSDPRMRAGNERSYPMNVKYYQEKWGGIMGREAYETPFDQGGSPRDCPTLDLSRLRALSWD